MVEAAVQGTGVALAPASMFERELEEAGWCGRSASAVRPAATG